MRLRPFILPLLPMLALTGCKDKVSPEETAAHLKAAEDLFAQKDYTRALVEVQAAIKGDPRSGDAHYLAAEIQEGLNHPREAFEEYARASVPEANNLKAQLKVIGILIDAKQYDAALGRINGTLGSHPNDPDALGFRALAEQRGGARDKARLDAQAALGRAPGQVVATAVLATDALLSNNADKALEVIGTGLKKHPDDATLLRLRAAALASQNKGDDAASIYASLVAGEPTSVHDRLALADLEAKGDRVDEGERVLRDGVKAVPTSNEMRLALVNFLGRYRGQDAAGNELKAAITDHPQDTAFDLLRAEQLLRTGHADQAIATLQAAVDRVPDGPARQAVRLGLARLRAEQGDDPEARKLLDTVLAAKPDADEALLLRATLLLRNNDPAHAIPDLLAVAGRQPRNVAPFNLLADAYVQQSDWEKATDALKKVIYFDPKSLNAAIRLSEVGLNAGKPDASKAALSDFVSRNPDSTEGRVALVRWALTQKDWTLAQSAIDGLRRNPGADQAVATLSAQLLEAKGQSDAAMAAYAKRLDPASGKPLDRDALQGYWRSALAAKKTDAAVSTVSTLAGKLTGSDAAAAYLILAGLNHTTGNNDGALAAAQAAVEAAPKEPGGYLDLATLQRTAQPQQAVATLGNGLAAGAPPEPLLMLRAAIQEQGGDTDGAMASYREILKNNPRAAIAANNFASLAADARPSDKAALTEARVPIQRFAGTTNPAILDTLAWLDYRLGDFEAAKALLLRAKANESPNAQLRYHYGAVLIALGERDAGQSAVRSALAQPDFPGHAEAQRLLTE